MQKEELLILAPSYEMGVKESLWVPCPLHFEYPENRKFTEVIEEFVDEGIAFPFDEDQKFPEQLPDNLDQFRCILIDPARKAEFETGKNAEQLLDFRKKGGYVCYPRLDSFHLRMHVLRTIVTAGLTRKNNIMLDKLKAVDDQKLLDWWISIIPEKAAQYNEWAWGDPVAYHFYWPVKEAADYLGKPELFDPLWENMHHALKTYPEHNISCGRRFALQLYERTQEKWILDKVLKTRGNTVGKSWDYNGVTLGQDLKAPEECDASELPERVMQNLWVWPETAGNMGDSLGYLSRVTGDMSHAEAAVKQVLTTHKWCFNKTTSLWHHVGRPDGPDMQSAPWGRGCGWMLYGVRGLLADLPQTHPAISELIKILSDGLEGFLKFQDEYGLWHNVVDDNSEASRQDSCITWMVINTYARAFWKGWLKDERIPPMLERAWQGLKIKIWRGLPLAHCHGTSYMTSRQGYLARPHMRFMGAAVMHSYVELMRMRGKNGI